MVGVRTHGAEKVPRGPKPGSYLSGRGLLIVPPGQVAARNAQQHDTIIAPPRGVEPRACMSCPCPPSSGLMREATTGTATIRGMHAVRGHRIPEAPHAADDPPQRASHGRNSMAAMRAGLRLCVMRPCIAA